MKTPAFWYRQSSPISLLLLPFSFLYDTIGTLKRAYTAPVQLPIPVICVGNATAGGAGKTPVALHIGAMLRDKGVKAFYLSRGYGGMVKNNPVLVNPQKHTAAQVGDEPLLLAAMLPTVVCPDRVAGAKLAIKKGAEAIVMDDGYQNPSLVKSLSVLVVDGQRGFGNGRLIPAGPLREKADAAIRRAHMVILMNRSTRAPAIPKEKAQYNAVTRLKDAAMFKGKKLYLFCGIAHPEKFFEMMSATGAKIVGNKAFADHHPYTLAELNSMIKESSGQKAVLVTTTKDYVRVPPELRDCMIPAELALEFDNEGSLDYVLDYVLGRLEEAPPAPETTAP